MQVTDKIEKVAQTVPDVDYVTSYSRPGVSVVNVDATSWIEGKDPSAYVPYRMIDGEKVHTEVTVLFRTTCWAVIEGLEEGDVVYVPS